MSLISLGCAKNRVDSEIILGQLRDQGFEIVRDGEPADTVIVNTCGFIDEARRESIDTLLEAAGRKGRDIERLFVAGCMVNRYAEELAAEIPEIDGFIGLDDLAAAPQLVALGSSSAPSQSASHLVFDHTASRQLTTRGYAFLKVAEGCNNPCTFCAIPVWRGRFRSRTIESLVAEAATLEAAGATEVCLVAQDTTRYGEDLGLGKHGLARLLEALLVGTTAPWIRFLYAYPTTLDDEVLGLMGSEPRLVPYLDIPLQHSHPEILRAMRRGGGPDRYLRQLERARTLVPDLFVRTTFIVGFPGERAEHFDHLVEFVQRASFDHLGVFVWSPEPDTPSYHLAGRPPRRVATDRRKRLLDAQRGIAHERRQRLVGRVLEVLVEGPCSETEHLLEGRHAGMAPEVDGRVLINDGTADCGRLAQVEITDAFADDLVGRIVGPAGSPGVVVAGGSWAGSASESGWLEG